VRGYWFIGYWFIGKTFITRTSTSKTHQKHCTLYLLHCTFEALIHDKFQIGDTMTYQKVVSEADVAAFESGKVHPVYATFALARDAEWACRLFVLEMKEADEEGIGTFVNVEHISPALVGQTVTFVATIKELKGNSIVCTYTASIGSRLVAKGEQGQKILKLERLQQLFGSLKDE
jgi:fluoroacetyl-CoA thioesterase